MAYSNTKKKAQSQAATGTDAEFKPATHWVNIEVPFKDAEGNTVFSQYRKIGIPLDSEDPVHQLILLAGQKYGQDGIIAALKKCQISIREVGQKAAEGAKLTALDVDDLDLD